MTLDYEAVIGLEVHAQLRTQSKLFCRCPTTFGAPPNSQVCPTCLALPGALPVLNGAAVRMAVMAGLATSCTIAERSIFARKNYFYPDLPKGYQISQFDRPLCSSGHLDIVEDGQTLRIGITRIHMEEDAGKSIHGGPGSDRSMIDLNRAGVPLIEIVSEPDLTGPDQAITYLKELRAILVYLDVCDGNMEEASFRCDANVSVRPVGQQTLGTRCEIKNLNSFRSVRDAIGHEIKRQVQSCRDGEPVIQQTRLWDVDNGRTEPMRSKEEAHDYRYFPDPDLLPLCVEAQEISTLQATLPELPAAKRTRLQQSLGLASDLVESLCEEPERVATFEGALAGDLDAERAKSMANFLMTRVLGALNRSTRRWHEIDDAIETLAKIHDQWRAGSLSNKMLAEVLEAFGNDTPLHTALNGALDKVGSVVSDEATLCAVIDEIVARFPDQRQRYKEGESKLLGFFMGQVMGALEGKGNARLVSELLRARLVD